MGKKIKKNGKLGDSTLELLATLKSSSQQVSEAIGGLERQTYGTDEFSKGLQALESLVDQLRKGTKSAAHSLKKEIKKYPKREDAASKTKKGFSVKKPKSIAKAQ